MTIRQLSQDDGETSSSQIRAVEQPPQQEIREEQMAESQMAPRIPQTPPVYKVAPKEPQGQRVMTVTTGSAQRKRSRTLEEGGQGSAHQATKIHECINKINVHIENLQRNGQRGNTGTVRAQMYDIMKEIMGETTNILAKMVNLQDLQINNMRAEKLMKDKLVVLQEENNSVKQQVIDLQMKIIQKEQEEKTATPLSYAQAASKQVVSNIINGKQMPLPYVAQSIKQAPSECIIVFKFGDKGEMATKQEQENFRKVLREVLGDEEMRGISVIRPTRFGGYTIILQNEKIRNEVFDKLRNNERLKELWDVEKCMVAPIKRVAKVVCKEAPDDISIEQIKVDMFGKHNPALQTVNPVHRTGKIYRTRLGLIFELSGYEMMAIQSQGWRIRCDLARELRVEEFISLQQCYACLKFGHSANECKADDVVCRLCGRSGHAGKDCPEKNNKEQWRCANCKRMNQTKNMQLDERHAAAQLHKCPIARQQKNVRKIQLASTGVFTTPIQRGEEVLKERQIEETDKQRKNGARGGTIQNDLRRNRSQSIKRYNEVRANFTRNQVQGGRRENMMKMQGKEDKNKVEENPYVQRVIKVPQPQTEDGWRKVGRRGGKQSESSGEARGSVTQENICGRGEMEVEEEVEEFQRPSEEMMQVNDE